MINKKIINLIGKVQNINPKNKKNYFLVAKNNFFEKLEDHLLDDDSFKKLEVNSYDDIYLLLVTIDFLYEIEEILNSAVRINKAFCVFINFSKNIKEQELITLMENYNFRLFSITNSVCLVFLKLQIKYEYLFSYNQGDKELLSFLKASKWQKKGFILNNNADIIFTKASNLLTASRFDIALKSLYARLFLLNLAKKWREYLYYEQVIRVTGPGKLIKEFDGSGKEGLSTFLNVFNSLIKEKDSSNFPLFPCTNNLIPLDGAHRIAASIAKNQKIKAIKINNTFPHNTNYLFFKSTSKGHISCPDEILDEGAIEYCRIKHSCAIVFLFPCVDNHNLGRDMLSTIGDIVYEKKIFLSPRAGEGLLRQVYLGHPWLNWSGNSQGFKSKVRNCFPIYGKLTTILLDNFDPKELRLIKLKIRKNYNCSNSIHITDSTEETLNAAKVIFNKNSLFILEKIKAILPEFHNKLFDFKDWMIEKKLDPELVCIDSSAVLSLLGLRECKDIDYLYHGNHKELRYDAKYFSCHNKLAYLYDTSIDQIIGDPRLHFWYMGIKFCIPKLVLKMKSKRAEKKDVKDVFELNKVLEESIFYKFQVLFDYFLRRIKFYISKIKIKLKSLYFRFF